MVNWRQHRCRTAFAVIAALGMQSPTAFAQVPTEPSYQPPAPQTQVPDLKQRRPRICPPSNNWATHDAAPALPGRN